MNLNPNTHLRLDETGFELIKTWEGSRNQAYQDSVGIWTIGIGFTRYSLGEKVGQRVKSGDYLSNDEIRAEFLNQVQTYENAVKNAITQPLTQSQFNACVSLCYNIGAAAFAKSSIARNLNQRKYQAAQKSFARYVYAGGRYIQGLTNRRAEEMKEFFRNG